MLVDSQYESSVNGRDMSSPITYRNFLYVGFVQAENTMRRNAETAALIASGVTQPRPSGRARVQERTLRLRSARQVMHAGKLDCYLPFAFR